MDKSEINLRGDLWYGLRYFVWLALWPITGLARAREFCDAEEYLIYSAVWCAVVITLGCVITLAITVA